MCLSLANITAKYGCKICPVTPLNPISNTCKISQLTNDLMHLYVTDGRNPFTTLYFGLPSQHVVSCVPTSLLKSFPKGVRGVAAFSWSALAFPRQVRIVTDKFSLCLESDSSALGVSFLESGKNWTIYRGNSMKFTGNGTACFAFVDGGLDVKDPIVVGTFQMENNFMFFDLQNQRLGFSSSCSGFNFTLPY
ncbi:aspartic peptidase A1 family protein [Tanacetum coccineum]|uniref:Aspartic peptidase A1 family protein n=1 Tax=Tanacetum coccineum TaxID=301880 RepID=A0ABQ5HLW4_9ASTR